MSGAGPAQAADSADSMEQHQIEEDEISLVSVQQNIDDFQQRLLEAGVGQNQADQADQQLLTDLTALRTRTERPTFFAEMKKEFRGPLVSAFIDSGVFQDIKVRLSFNAQGRSADVADVFNTGLQECLTSLVSANEFYTILAFTALYKRSFFRLFAGVGCSFLEAEVSLTVAASIINSTLYTASVGYVVNMSDLIGYLNTAYQSCSQENIIKLLGYLGVSQAAAPQIYKKMVGLTKEQTQFVLKCLFLKRVVGGIEAAEQPGHAHAQGQPPPPTFIEMISRPSLLLGYLKSLGPGLHGIAGPPGVSLQGRTITSFREFMNTIVTHRIRAQLDTVFPDTADAQLKLILFNLLLKLNDNHTEEDILIKFALLRKRLYRCLEDKYTNKKNARKISIEDFHQLCTDLCPGLLESGLTHDTIARIYGPNPDIDSFSSTAAVRDSPPGALEVDDTDTVSRVMRTLRSFPLKVAKFARPWFRKLVPESSIQPDTTHKKSGPRGDATLQFLKSCAAIKTKIDKKYHTHIDAVQKAFQNTVSFNEDGNLKVSEPTDYDAQIKTFNDTMSALKKLSKYPKVILELLLRFQEAAYENVDDNFEVLAYESVPFGGNSLSMLVGHEPVIKRINEALQSMIQSSERCIVDINSSDDSSDDTDTDSPIIPFPQERLNTYTGFSGSAASGGNPGGNPGGFGGTPGAFGSSMSQGGRSRSRKRSVSKRTRRKGIAKKQNSKKNKRQSRRKVRRASSRKGRK
jgi:hypothetical protein